MKVLYSAIFVLLSVYTVESAPVVRGVAPNSAMPGETVTVRVVVEGIPETPAKSEISFGTGIQVRSIRNHSFQIRHDERRMLFLQLEIRIDNSATPGARTVRIADSAPGQASLFYVRTGSEPGFGLFKQIQSPERLIPWRLLSANLDQDPNDELVSVNISAFAEGTVDIIQPFENKLQTIRPVSDGHLVSAREATLADKNGDGILDLSILNWLQFDVIGGVLVRARNSGDATFVIESDRASRIADLFITSGNFDGDGFDDLALVGFTGEIFVYRGGSKPGFRFKTVPTSFRGEIHGLLAADVNGDGFDDLTLALDNERTGKKEFGIAIADTKGKFRPLRRISTPYSEEGPWTHAIADLNNDGNVEFVFTSDNYRSLLTGTYSGGHLTFRPAIRVECNGLAVRDIDADGDADVACAGGDVDQIAIFRTSGSTYSRRITLNTPRYPVSVAIGDWNGDQRPDLAAGFGKMYFPHTQNERQGVAFWLQE